MATVARPARSARPRQCSEETARVPDHGPATATRRAAPDGGVPAAGRDRPGRGARRRRDLDPGRAAAPAWDMGVVSGPAPGGGLRPGGRPVVLAARNTVPAAGRAVTAASVLAGQACRWRSWSWSATGCPSPPRPGTGSGSWRAASARWSACRSSRPSAWPPTRPWWTCRGGRGRRWPRSGRSPASRRHARRRQPE